VLGECDLPVVKGASRVMVDFLVTSDGPCILGLDGLRKMNVAITLATNVDGGGGGVSELIQQCNGNKGGMKVQPVHLDVDSDPLFFKSRPLAYGMREGVKRNIDSLVADGILSPVRSSSWATPIVTVLKANGEPRICGDYSVSLNRHIKQAATTTHSVEDMLVSLKDNCVFSKIDLSNAYLQVPLDQQSKELTTINTMWGLFQYNYLPFGLSVSPAIFQNIINDILYSLVGVRAYQDDLIVYGKTQSEHQSNVLQVLRSLERHNVAINAKKSVFGVSHISYLGYRIDGDGIKPERQRIEALLDAPKPDSAAGLRSFMGFMQYYSKFIPHFSSIAEPLFSLLSEDSYQWESQHTMAYDALLAAVAGGEALCSFDPEKRAQLTVDASEYGLGGILEQDGRMVLCISRRLNTAERNYSQTQKEALAIIWAVRRLHKYLYGNCFSIITDHSALEYLFNPSSSLSKMTSAMLQRWALELSAYNYSIEHRAGVRIPHADYMSRHAKQDVQRDVEVNFCNPVPIDRNMLIQETKGYYGSVLAGLKNGFSTSAKKRFPVFYSRREEFSVAPDGVLLLNDQVVIPPVCRRKMLQHLHSGHLGRDKMKSLARLICWWPCMNSDIVTFGKECKKCDVKPKTHISWKPWPVTYEAMQRVHADYCGPFLNKYYALIVEDSYSKFPEVFLTTNATADFTMLALQKFFSREGVAQVLVTDNGTHFSASHLQQWLKSINCIHVFTAPRHPKSNGLAENFVKSVKMAVKCCNPSSEIELHKVIDNFLLQYRNAVHCSTGKTPSILFKGRNLRMPSRMDTTNIMFYRGNNTRPCDGIILNSIGNRMFNIMDRAEGSLHRRHVEQVHISKPAEESSVPIEPVKVPVMEIAEEVVVETDNQVDDIVDLDATMACMDDVEAEAHPVVSSSPIASRRRNIQKPVRYRDDS
jgi:transposase InsO family protein